MRHLQWFYLAITIIFLYLAITDTSALKLFGIIRFFPYLLIASIVLLSFSYRLSWIKKGIICAFILVFGGVMYYMGLLAGFGCLGAGYSCDKEITDHLRIFLLFICISAGVFIFSSQRSEKSQIVR